MVSCAAGSREKFQGAFAHGVPIFHKIVLTSLVALLVYWCVHRRYSIERLRKSMNFGREGGCVGPYLAAPPTSARVQNGVELVDLACDMFSNCTGEVQARIGISGWCQRP